MARKHIPQSTGTHGLCGKSIQPTRPRDLTCNDCEAIQGVMRAARMGASETGLEAQFYPDGRNACRVECDTSTPAFRAFSATMRRGVEYQGAGRTAPFSVRGKSATGAVVRHMAA